MNITVNQTFKIYDDDKLTMAAQFAYDVSFNKTQTFSRFEEALIKKILAEIVAMGGDVSTLMETEYNQFQVIHGIHVSKGETQEHFTVSLFNNYGFAEKTGARRSARGASGLFHINLNEAFDVTSITQVVHMRLRR
jgi:hypothetical protein